MYSGLCLLGIIFVAAIVPETKGRDLDSIEKLFQKRNKKSLNDEMTGSNNNGIDNLGITDDNGIDNCEDKVKSKNEVTKF